LLRQVDFANFSDKTGRDRTNSDGHGQFLGQVLRTCLNLTLQETHRGVAVPIVRLVKRQLYGPDFLIEIEAIAAA